jgi:oligopeptide transport system permease protein
MIRSCFCRKKEALLLLKYTIKRLAYAILTLFVLITLTFFMMRLLPGDPFLGDKTVTGATLANMQAKYGLDKPVYVQYFMYLGNCLRGDLGTSITYNKPVRDIISEAFVVSADLGIRALIFAVIIGILLGMVAAVKRGSVWDSLSMFIAMVGVSVPSFIMGALFQYFLALQLRKVLGISLFPIQGWGSFAQTLLPSFALGLGSLATVSRLMRTSMLDVLSQDYIKTAKAKGLSQVQIILRHTLRNAIMPVLTILGPTVASVLTGTFVIESIFNIPGLGKYFVMSIKDLDYTMISGTTVFYGALLILCTLVVDLLYGLIDPRVKLEG